MNEISKFYPIINASYQTREAQGKRQLMTYFLLISLLTLFLILSLAYVYRQMRKISAIREELVNTNACLVKLNGEISETNNLLQERYTAIGVKSYQGGIHRSFPRSLLHLY